MAEQAPIIVKTYDLIKESIPVLARFPRDQRFFLGDQWQRLLLEVLDALLEAYYSKKKLPVLIPVNLKLERLRYRIRLSHDFNYLSHKQYGHFSEKVDEIGRMLGGWIKSEQSA